MSSPGQTPRRGKRLRLRLRIMISRAVTEVLEERAERDPEDGSTLRQIGQVRRFLVTFSNQQNCVLRKVRTYLANLEEENRRCSPVLAPPPGPVVPKARARKKAARRSRDCEASRPSRSPSPDSQEEEEYTQAYLSYLEPAPGACRGHVEEYTVMCPSPESEEGEESVEEVEVGEEGVQGVFLSKLELLAAEQCQRIVEVQEKRQRRKRRAGVSHVPEVSDKKIRQHAFLQSCLTSPPHLRRRAPLPRLPRAPPPPDTLAPRRPPAGPPGALQRAPGGASESRRPPPGEGRATRSKSPSIARMGQVDGSWDMEEEMVEESAEEEEMEGEGSGEEVGSVVARLEERDRLLKRRAELLEEVQALQARSLELRNIREVQKDNKEAMMRQNRETEAKIQTLVTLAAQLS